MIVGQSSCCLFSNMIQSPAQIWFSPSTTHQSSHQFWRVAGDKDLHIIALLEQLSPVMVAVYNCVPKARICQDYLLLILIAYSYPNPTTTFQPVHCSTFRWRWRNRHWRSNGCHDVGQREVKARRFGCSPHWTDQYSWRNCPHSLKMRRCAHSMWWKNAINSSLVMGRHTNA